MWRRRVLSLVSLFVLVSATSAAAQGRLESKFFDSDGVQIHYVDVGEGEPVVLIHGFTSNLQQNWKGSGLIDALRDDYRVIALDNRGHGRSGKPHDPAQYGIEMVNDSIRLLDHLDIDQAHFVGYSMGAFITSKLMTTYPQRVITATLGGAGWNRADGPNLELMDELATSLEEGNGITPLIRHLTPEGQPVPSEDELKSINALVMLVNDPKALAAVIRGFRGLIVPREDLEAHELPTLALIGDNDPLKEGVDAMKAIVPELNVVVIEDADHMTAPAKPEFRAAFLEFLSQHARVAVAAGAGS